MPHLSYFARLRRPIATWFALWIALLMALAPTISHALAAYEKQAQSVEVCTATGSRWISLTQSPAQGDQLPTLDHCPLCIGLGQLAPPPSTVSISILSAARVFAGASAPTSPAVSRWIAAAPRGPPAIS